MAYIIEGREVMAYSCITKNVILLIASTSSNDIVFWTLYNTISYYIVTIELRAKSCWTAVYQNVKPRALVKS